MKIHQGSAETQEPEEPARAAAELRASGLGFLKLLQELAPEVRLEVSPFPAPSATRRSAESRSDASLETKVDSEVAETGPEVVLGADRVWP